MSLVLYSVADQTASITLNRPEKRNALSPELVTELKNAFNKAEQDAAVKVVVLKANGESFCAGADLGYLQQLQNFSFEENLADSNHLKEFFLKIYTLNKVVIAQVQGHALAGGCGLAAVCDFTFAVPEAKFGYTEVRIGFIPALVSVFLIRKLGEQKARHLLLTGEIIKAEAALPPD
jgi:methylglutaconyl-CoA hydratase